jgi:hypothetical protein
MLAMTFVYDHFCFYFSGNYVIHYCSGALPAPADPLAAKDDSGSAFIFFGRMGINVKPVVGYIENSFCENYGLVVCYVM